MQPIQEYGPLKIDFRADWTHESIPTAWELKNILSDVISIPEAYKFLSLNIKEIKGWINEDLNEKANFGPSLVRLFT